MRYAVVTKNAANGYEAFVPDHPDCESRGESAEDAINALRNTLQSHLEAMLQQGEAIEAPTAKTELIEAALLNSADSETTTYLVVIDKAPNNYAAWVPDLPVCLSVGDTLAEMRAMIKEAIEFHIEALEDCGDLVPVPESRGSFIEVVVARAEPVAD